MKRSGSAAGPHQFSTVSRKSLNNSDLISQWDYCWDYDMDTQETVSDSSIHAEKDNFHEQISSSNFIYIIKHGIGNFT